MISRPIIDDILDSYEQIGAINHVGASQLPSKQRVKRTLYKIKQLLFPGYFDDSCSHPEQIHEFTAQLVQGIAIDLSMMIEKCQNSVDTTFDLSAKTVTRDLFSYIPKLRETLKEDINAILNGDPAATNEEEVMLAYPGFWAVVVYRVAHFLHNKNVPLIPRMMTEISHSQTGIDIHPQAKIGKRFCIDHGTGIVIGQTAVIGNDVKLYQGVTIGALSIPKRENAAIKRHPTLEDGVTVYARTTILGGKTIIGRGAVIGGNLWLTESVAPNTKLTYERPLSECSTKS